MRWPWTPRDTVPPVQDLRDRVGFFDGPDVMPRRIDGDALYRRVFQRTHADLKASGRAPQVTGVEYVTDSADDWNTPSLKQAWLQNASIVPASQWAWYSAQSFIGYQMCAVLSQHWLVDRACSLQAEDATRVPYEITAADDDTKVPDGMFEYMAKLDKRFHIKDNAREFVRHCNIYGIRIALFLIEGVNYEAPFNPDGITPGSYRGISQVDPYWITPELDLVAASDTASPHFYEPTWWRINGKRYHRTHLVIIKTCDVPDVLKPTYYYGGIPLTQQIYERVYAAERTANEAPQLALTKRTRTIEGANLEAAAGNQGGMERRVGEFVQMQDSYGVQVLGGTEKLVQQDTSLTDFDQLIMTQYQIVAAIGKYPYTKLMGTSPKGMDATGEFEEAQYHETLEGVNEHRVRPLIERHHLCSMRSYVMPRFKLTMPIETTVVFDKLDAETGKERADRQLVESTAAKNYADTGALDGYDIREKLRRDDESGFTGIESLSREALEPPPLPTGDPNDTATVPVPTPAAS